jgi:hypothetical protein
VEAGWLVVVVVVPVVAAAGAIGLIAFTVRRVFVRQRDTGRDPRPDPRQDQER